MNRFNRSGQFNARRLHFLQAVERTGGIRAAAELLDINPSVISREISRLERDHGVSLLEKCGRNVILTPMGELLVAYYRDTVQREADVLSIIEDHGQLRRGRITIALGEGYTYRLLSGALKGFMQHYPEVFVELVTGSTREVTDMVSDARAEIGLCAGESRDPSLRVHRFSGAPFCALMAPDNPLAQAETLSLKDLTGQRMICMQEHFAAQQYLRGLAQQEGVTLVPACYCDMFAVALTLAMENVGVAFMTQDAARQAIDSGALVAIPLSHTPALPFQHQIITRIGHRLTPAARYLHQQLLIVLSREEHRAQKNASLSASIFP